MARSCLVCGRDIAEGNVCPNCDSRGVNSKAQASTAAEPLPLTARTAADILTAARIPAAIISAQSRSVRVISQEVRRLLGIDDDDNRISLRKLESRLGTKLPPLGEPFSTRLTFDSSQVEVSMVPLSGGADGAVLIFHRQTPFRGWRNATESAWASLRALREALTAASKYRASDPLLEDTAATIDRIVSVLDAPPPADDWSSTQPHRLPGSIAQVVRQTAARYISVAELKGIQLQVDLPEIVDVVRDGHGLEDALEILLENAIYYVPKGGQIFIGARTTEQKGKPVALFFVMDNGPVVPEELRNEIFTPEFQWTSSNPRRTGRNLSFCYTFAGRHGGQCWVDSKSGKSCTFFLSMRIL